MAENMSTAVAVDGAECDGARSLKVSARERTTLASEATDVGNLTETNDWESEHEHLKELERLKEINIANVARVRLLGDRLILKNVRISQMDKENKSLQDKFETIQVKWGRAQEKIEKKMLKQNTEIRTLNSKIEMNIEKNNAEVGRLENLVERLEIRLKHRESRISQLCKENKTLSEAMKERDSKIPKVAVDLDSETQGKEENAIMANCQLESDGEISDEEETFWSAEENASGIFSNSEDYGDSDETTCINTPEAIVVDDECRRILQEVQLN